MTSMQRNCRLIVWLFAAFVLISAGSNTTPSFAETIYYSYDDLNRVTFMETPEKGATRYEYDEVGNRLSKTFVMRTCIPACPTGFILDGGICHQPAGCPGGTLNTQYDLCAHDILFGCPAGYAYVPERSRCEAPPVCSAGSYDATHNHCHKPINKSCASGYTYVATRDRCERTPSCPSGGIYSEANNRCEAACTYSYICSLEDTESGGWGHGHTYVDYDTCVSSCSQTAVCIPGVDPASGGEVYTCPYGTDHACDGSRNCTRTGTCSLNTSCDCPSVYTWNGAVCTARATCPNGSLDGDEDVCYRSYTPSCDSGWSYGVGTGVCYQNASCTSDGVFSPAYDVCYAGSTTGCSSGYAWDPAISLCRMPPQCPTGSSYNTANDRCESAPLPCP